MKPGRLPPSPPGNVLLGHLWPYLRNARGFITRRARDCGDAVRLRLLPGRVSHALFHPDHTSPARPATSAPPFGDGPRVRVGQQFAVMEAVLILATVRRRRRPSVGPRQQLRVMPSATLRPEGGVPLAVHTRQPAAAANGGRHEHH